MTRAVLTRAALTGAARPAWEAWRAGRFVQARDGAAELVATGRGGDEARHVLALARCALGDLENALATYRSIGSGYRRLGELNEPILWAHLHLGDLPAAQAFADRRGMTRRGTVAARLRLAAERPLEVVADGGADGVVEVPFTDDPLTPYMPGFAGSLNGRPAVLRLDTGGSFVHLSAQAAAAHGIDTVARERGFGALRRHWIGYGVADLELGPVSLRHVPVAVHEGALPAQAVAAVFGTELGPIIGSNILRRFLATVDGPHRRLLLSPRGVAAARTCHLARLPVAAETVEFGWWGEHMMIARGSVGDRGVPLLVDSGLVAVHPEQGQAAVLASRRGLASWGVARPPEGRFAELPGRLGLGSATRASMTALPVSERTWRSMGDWGGIDVAGLISWGFLRHFTWTIDVDRHRYLLAAP